MSGNKPTGGTPCDDVDSLVAGWLLVLPGSDATPLHVLSRITRIAHHLERARRQVFARQNLQLWEFDVLSALRRSPALVGLTPGQLVVETLVTSGTMTNRIDRLADRGLVTKQQSATDRRTTYVRLTRQGREMIEAAMSALLDREHELLSPVSDADMGSLSVLLKSLLMSLDRSATTARSGSQESFE